MGGVVVVIVGLGCGGVVVVGEASWRGGMVMVALVMVGRGGLPVEGGIAFAVVVGCRRSLCMPC